MRDAPPPSAQNSIEPQSEDIHCVSEPLAKFSGISTSCAPAPAEAIDGKGQEASERDR